MAVASMPQMLCLMCVLTASFGALYFVLHSAYHDVCDYEGSTDSCAETKVWEPKLEEEQIMFEYDWMMKAQDMRMEAEVKKCNEESEGMEALIGYDRAQADKIVGKCLSDFQDCVSEHYETMTTRSTTSAGIICFDRATGVKVLYSPSMAMDDYVTCITDPDALDCTVCDYFCRTTNWVNDYPEYAHMMDYQGYCKGHVCPWAPECSIHGDEVFLHMKCSLSGCVCPKTKCLTTTTTTSNTTTTTTTSNTTTTTTQARRLLSQDRVDRQDSASKDTDNPAANDIGDSVTTTTTEQTADFSFQERRLSSQAHVDFITRKPDHFCDVPPEDYKEFFGLIDMQACANAVNADPECDLVFWGQPRICYCMRRRVECVQFPTFGKGNTIYEIFKPNPLVNLGIDGCSATKPCPLCHGDCDSDADCEGDSRCWQRDDDTEVPGCDNIGLGDVAGYDYCYEAMYSNLTDEYDCTCEAGEVATVLVGRPFTSFFWDKLQLHPHAAKDVYYAQGVVIELEDNLTNFDVFTENCGKYFSDKMKYHGPRSVYPDPESEAAVRARGRHPDLGCGYRGSFAITCVGTGPPNDIYRSCKTHVDISTCKPPTYEEALDSCYKLPVSSVPLPRKAPVIEDWLNVSELNLSVAHVPKTFHINKTSRPCCDVHVASTCKLGDQIPLHGTNANGTWEPNKSRDRITGFFPRVKCEDQAPVTERPCPAVEINPGLSHDTAMTTFPKCIQKCNLTYARSQLQKLCNTTLFPRRERLVKRIHERKIELMRAGRADLEAWSRATMPRVGYQKEFIDCVSDTSLGAQFNQIGMPQFRSGFNKLRLHNMCRLHGCKQHQCLKRTKPCNISTMESHPETQCFDGKDDASYECVDKVGIMWLDPTLPGFAITWLVISALLCCAAALTWCSQEIAIYQRKMAVRRRLEAIARSKAEEAARLEELEKDEKDGRRNSTSDRLALLNQADQREHQLALREDPQNPSYKTNLRARARAQLAQIEADEQRLALTEGPSHPNAVRALDDAPQGNWMLHDYDMLRLESPDPEDEVMPLEDRAPVSSNGAAHLTGVKELSFEPGPLGMDLRGAEVIKIDEGQQAEARGIKVGHRLLALGGEPVPVGAPEDEIKAWVNNWMQKPRPLHAKFAVDSGSVEDGDDEVILVQGKPVPMAGGSRRAFYGERNPQRAEQNGRTLDQLANSPNGWLDIPDRRYPGTPESRRPMS